MTRAALRTPLLLACLFVVALARAQDANAPEEVDPDCGCVIHTYAHQFSLDLTALYDASALRNDLAKGLWLGRDLDRTMRERSATTSEGPARAGYLLEGRLTYAWDIPLFGYDRVRARLGVAFHDVMGVRYANDLYQVTFFGNEAYENRTAALGPSAVMQIRYQTVGIGIEERKDRSFLRIDLVNGSRLHSAVLRTADLYTAPDGRFLDLMLDGDYVTSDTGRTGAFSNGLGMAISGEWRKSFLVSGRKAYWSVGVEDLGVIGWNSGSQHVYHDAPVHYEGIRVSDVLDLDGALVGRRAWQDTLGLGFRSGPTVQPLPTRAYATLRIPGPHFMIYELQADVRNLPGYLPYGDLSATHRFGRNLGRLDVSYGGFGGWRAGLGLTRMLPAGWSLGLRTTNVIGALSDQARGLSALLQLARQW